MSFIKEELLHHIWQHRLFSHNGLLTTDQQTIEVLKPGVLNTDAGPDFKNARLRINGTEWAGNVEIHICSSDWLKHQHQHDAAYGNIILHVVFENDLQAPLGAFPTLELKHAVSDQLLRKYQNLSSSPEAIPCGKQLLDVPELVRNAWFDSLLVGRLQRKSAWMHTLVDTCDGDLEQAFMCVVFSAFGMKVNAEPFEQLAKSTSWKILVKHQDNLFQLEAILFGNAGLLEAPKDEYQRQLKKEYDFLQHKYSMQPMEKEQWKFLRLRPANFPTVRIAQLAALFHRTGAFFRWFSGQTDTVQMQDLAVSTSAYWVTHYNFGKESAAKPKQIGATMARNIIINAVAPFLFVSAVRNGKPALQETAFSLLQRLASEKNVKVNAFEQHGLKVQNAAESQALIELRTNYCDHKKCLICSIGANILKRDQ